MSEKFDEIHVDIEKTHFTNLNSNKIPSFATFKIAQVSVAAIVLKLGWLQAGFRILNKAIVYFYLFG